MKKSAVHIATPRRLIGAAGVVGLAAAIVVALGSRQRPYVLAHPDDELPPWFGEPDASPVAIRGVVHSATLPLTVRLAIDTPDPGIWSGLEVQTGPDGRFDFGAQRRGKYLVQALGPNDASRLVAIDTAGDPSSVDVHAFPCRNVEGRAFMPFETRGTINSDAHGIPVIDAQVEVAGRVVARTGPDGRFRFCGPRDEFGMLMRAPGFAVDESYVFADRGIAKDEVFFTSRNVSLDGLVTAADGRAAAGVGIQAIRHTQMSHGAFTDMPMAVTTDAGGRFSFDGLAAAEYSFRVLKGSARQDLTAKFDLTDGRNTVHLVLPAFADEGNLFDEVGVRAPDDPKGAWVRGRVLRAGQPIADAEITGHVPSGAMMWRDDATRSQHDGSFALFIASVELDRPRPVSITATHAGLSLTGGVGGVDLEVAPGDRLNGVTIEVGRGFVATGIATDPDGRPIPGIVVAASEMEARALARKKQLTDAQGSFSVRFQEVGRYRLRAYDAEGEAELLPPPGTLSPSVDVKDLDGGIADLAFTISRDPPAIRGVVVDDQGRRTKATVRVVWLGGAHPVDTNDAGEFALRPILDEPYVIAANAADGRVAYVQGVYLPAAPLRLVLQRPGRLKVHCSNLRPMGSIFVSDQDIGFSAECEEEVTALPSGRFTLFARHGHRQEATAIIDVRPGQLTETTLRLTPTSEVSGRAIEVPGGRPVEGAECEAVIPNGLTGVLGAGEDARSAPDGTFKLTLTNMRMLLRCEDPRFVRASAPIDVGATTGIVEVRMVRWKPSAVDLGVILRSHTQGALVVASADEAATAGLRPGDVVEGANGIPLAGMSLQAVTQFAFRLERGQSVHWAVKRGDEALTLHAEAPVP